MPLAPTLTRAPTGQPQVQLTSLISSLDRFVTPPVLVTMAAAFHISLGQAAIVASIHYIFYGLTQPLWALASDRLGRVRVMRLALAGAGVTGVLAAAAPSVEAMAALRGLTGAFIGGLVPAAIVWLGDSVDVSGRQRAMSGLVGMGSLGACAATALAGGLAQFGAWRVGLAFPAVLALLLLLRFRVPEPQHAPSVTSLSAFTGLLRRGRTWAVIGVAVAEGSAVFGALTFLAPALEDAGRGAAIAGLAVAGYGAAGWATTRWLEERSFVPGGRARIATCTAIVVIALACAASGNTVLIFGSGALLGLGYGLVHPMMQAWATEVVPDARAPIIALFASSLFVGGAIAAAAGGALASHGQFTVLFTATALVAVVFGIGAFAARPLGASHKDG
jgi:MFS family permease